MTLQDNHNNCKLLAKKNLFTPLTIDYKYVHMKTMKSIQFKLQIK